MEQRNSIEAIDKRISLVMADGWFEGEYRENWPDFTVEQYVDPEARGRGTQNERDALLAEADIIFGGWPFPIDMCARAPKLKWFHQAPAGANNLRRGDIWNSDVIATTSRGYGNTLAIAEFALAGILYFAKSMDQAERDCRDGQFHKRAFKPLMLDGKTICVIGAGGIGGHLGRIAAGIGMRAVGTRAHPDGELPKGFSDIRGPEGLLDLLSESHVAAVCCQWTPDTTNLMDRAAFAAMKPDGILCNIARGEIVDEDAMLDALDSGQLRGAALDCYVGEFEEPPSDRLWQHPRVLITPHTSGKADENRRRATALFCENLRAFLDGKPMENVIDWQDGY
jgi:phosphoglycerate dehydrogenase-like enzyme